MGTANRQNTYSEESEYDENISPLPIHKKRVKILEIKNLNRNSDNCALLKDIDSFRQNLIP